MAGIPGTSCTNFDDHYRTPNKGLKVTPASTREIPKMGDFRVEPLTELCENYILEHFEEFTVSHLSLLPLSKRRDLLWRLPTADVCLRLENTDFVQGLDLAAYWKSPRVDLCSLELPKDSDIERYVSERWPNEVEHAKAWLYGQVATFQVCPPDGCEFCKVLSGDEYVCFHTLSFLYGIPTPHSEELTFPPRYQQEEKLLESYPWHMTEQIEQDIVDAIVRCFSGERPKIFPNIQLLTDADIHHDWDLSDADLSLVSEVEYVSIQCRPFDDRSVEWTMKLVNNASNLQVIILQGCNVTNEYYCLDLDEFCEHLATCQQFWSKFQILKIVPGILEKDELDGYGVDTPEKYTVTRAGLNLLITAYFSAPTNHSQLVQFSFTNIVISAESRDNDSDTATESQDDNNSDSTTDITSARNTTDANLDCDPPTIDRTYLQFKNIRLSDCYFDSNKATPEEISKWLGQDIKILEKDDETSSILFQIDDNKDSSSVLGHKRKYCEVAEPTSDQVN